MHVKLIKWSQKCVIDLLDNVMFILEMFLFIYIKSN